LDTLKVAGTRPRHDPGVATRAVYTTGVRGAPGPTMPSTAGPPACRPRTGGRLAHRV